MSFLTRQRSRDAGSLSYREHLALDCAWIFEHAEAIVRLRGSNHSKGANAEMAVAAAIGLHVYYETADGTFIGYGTTPPSGGSEMTEMHRSGFGRGLRASSITSSDKSGHHPPPIVDRMAIGTAIQHAEPVGAYVRCRHRRRNAGGAGDGPGRTWLRRTWPQDAFLTDQRTKDSVLQDKCRRRHRQGRRSKMIFFGLNFYSQRSGRVRVHGDPGT